MNNLKHTPGPWAISQNDFESFEIQTDELTVCNVLAQGEYEEQGEFNAKLIAAAPDLLLYLTKLLEADKNGDFTEFDKHLQGAYDTINKATGKQQQDIK